MPFTEKETAYLRSRRIGRLATVGADGRPHNVPVGFRLNDDGTIDITGRDLGRSRKYRDVAEQPAVSFVVDDIAGTDPWVARGVEIRGRAAALATGGRAHNPSLAEELIRITPERIVAWGVDASWQEGTNGRDVG
ncbi:PPOX class F420-dependent oxidoreductase [Kitasatospora sp. NPDC101447]|uniref:PPOX class F420-dependent oxidoreductase n=1 Tax=Kitasatospora sp. NPDC101447 TaxID=3364102 RepID=UPI0037F537D6